MKLFSITVRCYIHQTSVDSDISPRSVEVTDLKRKHEEESKDMMAPMEVEVSSDIEGANGNISEGFQSKKKCSMPTADRPSSEGYDLNFPLPGEKGLPCLVKVRHVSLYSLRDLWGEGGVKLAVLLKWQCC